MPDFGGEFKEGLVGQPRFINPLYLSDNDADRDLVEIIFSGLLKYDQNSQIIKDLAQDYQIKEEGRVFEFELRKDIFWHDGEPLTAQDIVFTIEIVQAPQYKSPLRIEWLGIRVEMEGERKVKFYLQKKYPSFLETIAHLKILPKHIFQDLSPEDFPWVVSFEEYLIGSGPFRIKEIKKEKTGYIKKIELERNEKYYLQKPFLEKVSFYFYQTPEDLLKAARRGEIDGFSLTQGRYLKLLSKEGFQVFSISLPRYFALFFNLRDSKILKNQKIREALAWAINKEEILERVFQNQGETVESPILPNFYGFKKPKKTFEFSPKKAEEILNHQGFKINPQTYYREKIVLKKVPPLFKKDLKYGNRGKDVEKLQECLARDKEVYPEGEITGYFGKKTKKAVIRFQEKYSQEILAPLGLKKGTGKVGGMTREKLNQICQEIPKEILPLKLKLTSSDKFPLKEIGEILKEQLGKIGVQLELRQIPLSEIQTKVLNKRNFEILLFGEALGGLPDPFPFWHSSQKDYPGLNLTGYQSKIADKLLEKARETSVQEERKKALEKFQDILIEDLPAIFLIRSYYFYLLAPEIKGFEIKKITEPAKRFSLIETCWRERKRVWK